MALKVKSHPVSGWYDLLLGEEKVGEVRKRVEHYNLRRSVTVTTWLLTWRGEPVGPEWGGKGWNTRKDAVAHAESLLRQEQR